MSLEGGSTCTECGILAENTALYFGGSTVRQAITQDLDLRGAKFLQYWGRIGSENNMTSCHRPICRKEGVLLDYSTDGGITWSLLHEMDYQKYISVRHDYILLPEDALTNTTRLRWWQPFVISNGIVVSGVERAQWALDNILIGGLAPYAHGDSLYFNGCQIRQAATKPLDLTRASKIMFVLQIGSMSQTDSCNSDLSGPHAVDKAVLLQYSVNNGITWHVIAQHQPKDFTQAQRVSYNVPLEARMKGVLLRWWQPRHNGTGHDQWALDHVEVVLTRKQNYMMNFSRQHGLRHFYNRRRRSLRRYP
uniref:Reelin n=1 Tax=Cebus imitator TaxID=2715852 RepID=A0A2K5SIH9_CEBIM